MARMRAPERRRQLLEVAAELFSQRGYRGTTTAELASTAGVTEPILYRHFTNKLDLFTTLIEEVGTEVIASWKQALEGEDDPTRRLRILLEGNPATHARGKGVYRVIFQAMSETELEPEIDAALRTHLARLHAFLQGEISRLQKAKIVRNDEPAAALASLLVYVGTGYGLTSPLTGTRISSNSGRKSIQRLLEELVSA